MGCLLKPLIVWQLCGANLSAWGFGWFFFAHKRLWEGSFFLLMLQSNNKPFFPVTPPLPTPYVTRKNRFSEFSFIVTTRRSGRAHPKTPAFAFPESVRTVVGSICRNGQVLVVGKSHFFPSLLQKKKFFPRISVGPPPPPLLLLCNIKWKNEPSLCRFLGSEIGCGNRLLLPVAENHLHRVFPFPLSRSPTGRCIALSYQIC